MPPLPQGRLSTQKLDGDQGRQIWQRALDLHLCLENAVGDPVDLWLTDNRRSMVSIRNNGSRFQLRLHHMFVEAPKPIITALAALLVGSPKQRTKARDTLQRFTRNNLDKIRRYDPPKRRVRVRTSGQFHDLSALYSDVITNYVDKDPKLAITWGRFSGRSGSGQRSVRLGSYEARRRLIRIHPLLDCTSVPAWVVRFVIFHEVLHELYPPIVSRKGRNQLHHEAFCRAEASHPDFQRFEAWTRDVLPDLMRSPDRK